MKYVITGGAGHISKPLAEKLLKAGHEVTVIGRNPKNLEALVNQGAKAAIGSVEDVTFLTKTFSGAYAVYTMVPPTFNTSDWKGYIGQVGKNYAEAIKTNKINYIVNLSSIGAHLPDGAGPVSGLYLVEQALNRLSDTHIRHLRPAYFYSNLLANAGMVKHMNIIGSNFGGDNFNMLLAHTNDIAKVAAEELLQLKFKSHTIRYIASDERSTNEIAAVLGAAVDKPELPWVVFSNEQALGGMLQAGLPEEIAKNYTEMGNAFQSGVMTEDYRKHKPVFSNTKLEDFAKEFATVYNTN